MIKLENIEVSGWKAAIRGLRNPMNSWDKSDSGLVVVNEEDHEFGYDPIFEYHIGKNDLTLMKSLSKVGNDHAKFLRMINVTVDITAPLYWWKEFDTYKVGTVANSCSTMHKIHSKEFTIDDFSHEHIDDFNIPEENQPYTFSDGLFLHHMNRTVEQLNIARNYYLKTKDKKYWWQMIQLLPSSYNQRRTVQLNYQVLKAMYHARKNHKLDEWREFCKWCETLPYFREVVIQDS